MVCKCYHIIVKKINEQTYTIKEVQENASEWLEEVNEPRDLLVVILANKLSNALNHIEYLERRLQCQ